MKMELGTCFPLVGGGTAGSLLAARISEKYNVLLLEAGGTPVPMSQTPYYTEIVALDPATNYLFRSVPQRNAAIRDGGVTLPAYKADSKYNYIEITATLVEF